MTKKKINKSIPGKTGHKLHISRKERHVNCGGKDAEVEVVD